MASPFTRRWPLYTLCAACIWLTVVAASAAVGWYGHPIADVLVGPGGVVSNIGLPRAHAEAAGLRFPDVVLEVDGRHLVARGRAPRARIWDEAVEGAFRPGRSRVTAIVLTHLGVRTVSLQVEPLEPLWWWLYAGAMLFAGALYVTAGLIAVWVSPGSMLARTFCKVGVSCGTLLGLTFDFHTTRALVPIFLVAFAMVPVSLLALALRLPDDAPALRRFPWLERAADW